MNDREITILNRKITLNKSLRIDVEAIKDKYKYVIIKR